MLLFSMTTKTGNKNGMNWLRPEKRLAIYCRDGLACVYCLMTLANGAKLTLDHLVPRKLGGTNAACNLVTACSICNSSRGHRNWRKFAKDSEVVRRVLRCIRRKVNITKARELITAHGGFLSALYGGANGQYTAIRCDLDGRGVEQSPIQEGHVCA